MKNKIAKRRFGSCKRSRFSLRSSVREKSSIIFWKKNFSTLFSHLRAFFNRKSERKYIRKSRRMRKIDKTYALKHIIEVKWKFMRNLTLKHANFYAYRRENKGKRKLGGVRQWRLGLEWTWRKLESTTYIFDVVFWESPNKKLHALLRSQNLSQFTV